MKARASAIVNRIVFALILVATISGGLGGVSLAQSPEDSAIAAKTLLRSIYDGRTDLQKVFAADWNVTIPAFRDAGMSTLEDWARMYGYKEYPAELAPYKPVQPPRALLPRAAAYFPIKNAEATFDFKLLTARSVYVVDVATREVLLAHNSRAPHPLASITKLMTATVALENQVSMGKMMAMNASDEVGGARLRVADGVQLTVRQIFDAMLVGSANNCAVAISRSTALTKQEFIAAMNAKAKDYGLNNTTFVDPSGIEVANTSNAEEIAALGFEAFVLPDVKRATTTSRLPMFVDGTSRLIKNTNGLLTDARNGLIVQGGKTGYLEESMWNLVVQMKDYRNRPVLVVVLGSGSQGQSFKDAERVAKWVWTNYRWVKEPVKS